MHDASSSSSDSGGIDEQLNCLHNMALLYAMTNNYEGEYKMWQFLLKVCEIAVVAVVAKGFDLQ